VDKDLVRRLVALVGHAPALWLFYGETLPRHLARANVVALGATAAAATAAGLARRGNGPARSAGRVWLIGHFAWGAYLASRLPRR